MSVADLHAHLASGETHVCQCWAIKRRDGATFGFTDHDNPLEFAGITFRAESGLSARALAATTGLAVNNTEALGLLQSDVIDEADIAAGRYDGAEITNWLVQWDDVRARKVQFRGTIGEISRSGGQFTAELRGLSDALNQPQGRSFLRTCSAVLGDGRCRFDTSDAAYTADVAVDKVAGGRDFTLSAAGFNDRWFEQGQMIVQTGAASGLTGAIKHDRIVGGQREVVLWHPLRAQIAAGDMVRIVAGCDKRAETCRVKFDNFINFQGFPDIPGDDWLVSVPRSSDAADGGSLTR